MNLVWNHTILTAVDVYWWQSAWTGYVNCPACWIILTHPWGKLIKSQLFGKHHFKGFCENLVLLILQQICSQKIKDSESKVINSSIFMVSPPRSQEKRWLTLPHFTLPKFGAFLACIGRYIPTYAGGGQILPPGGFFYFSSWAVWLRDLKLCDFVQNWFPRLEPKFEKIRYSRGGC